MKCSKVELTISAFLDNEATQSEWREAEKHMAACRRCAERYRQFQAGHELLPRQAKRYEPAPDLWFKLEQRIEAMPRMKWHGRMRNQILAWIDTILIDPPPRIRYLQVIVAAALVAVVALHDWTSPDLSHKDSRKVQSLSQSEANQPVSLEHLVLRERRQQLAASALATQVNDFFEDAGLILLEIKNNDGEFEKADFYNLKTTSQSLLERNIVIQKGLKEADLAVLQPFFEQLELIFLELAHIDENPGHEDIDLIKASILHNDLLIRIEMIDLGRSKQYTRPVRRQRDSMPDAGPEI